MLAIICTGMLSVPVFSSVIGCCFLAERPRPVATTVTRSASLIESSYTVPKITVASSAA
ncbi:hypothetical protein D3C81_1273320 [compost metagenome]